MIERQTINGREATIAYFDDAFQPVDKSTPGHYAKVLFDDGEMLILRDPQPEQVAAPVQDNEDIDGSSQFDESAWAKHRQRQKPRRIKINGQTLATWARSLLNNEMRVVEMAIRTGLQNGADNTEIAHLVIGSRKNNGRNGATELTRQHILRLAKGYLRAKSRMSGSATE